MGLFGGYMEITPEVVTAFREYYDEFTDPQTYSNNLVLKSLNKASTFTSGSVWGDYKYEEFNASVKAQALFAYAAHLVITSKLTNDAVSNGSLPSAFMAVASKSVGDESESYQRPQTTSEREQLASTSYGQEYLALYGLLGFRGLTV